MSSHTWGATCLTALRQADWKQDSKKKPWTCHTAGRLCLSQLSGRTSPHQAYADMQPLLPGPLMHQMLLLTFCTLHCLNNNFSEAQIELPLQKELLHSVLHCCEALRALIGRTWAQPAWHHAHSHVVGLNACPLVCGRASWQLARSCASSPHPVWQAHPSSPQLLVPCTEAP